MQKYIVFIATILITISVSEAGQARRESTYRDAWCRGETEVLLPNGTRADCVTTRHAIEVEFAHKWQQAIGQSLNFADQTGKQPAILLIIERDKDWRYYRKCRRLANKNGIRLWYITPAAL